MPWPQQFPPPFHETRRPALRMAGPRTTCYDGPLCTVPGTARWSHPASQRPPAHLVVGSVDMITPSGMFRRSPPFHIRPCGDPDLRPCQPRTETVRVLCTQVRLRPAWSHGFFGRASRTSAPCPALRSSRIPLASGRVCYNKITDPGFRSPCFGRDVIWVFFPYLVLSIARSLNARRNGLQLGKEKSLVTTYSIRAALTAPRVRYSTLGSYLPRTMTPLLMLLRYNIFISLLHNTGLHISGEIPYSSK